MGVEFGRKQLKKPTPQIVADIIAVFTVVGSILLAWVGTVEFIPAKPSTVIQSILGLLVAIANGIKPFFGVRTNQTNVPIDEVGTMEDK
jgi:hypothetical protein